MQTDHLQNKDKVRSKIEIVLYIYDQLLQNKVISSTQISNEFKISKRTFKRYIEDINGYFFNQYKNMEVIYDPHIKKYRLV